MASSSIQEYIFENKEKIPNGIYKGIQDLLKKQHEEEQYEGLFEVKYIEVKATSILQKSKYGKIPCNYEYDWNSGSEFDDEDYDEDLDEEFDKFCKKKDNTNVFRNNVDLNISEIRTKICKIYPEISGYCYDLFLKANKLNAVNYENFKNNERVVFLNSSDKKISRTPNGKVITKKEGVMIIDIQPYKK